MYCFSRNSLLPTTKLVEKREIKTGLYNDTIHVDQKQLTANDPSPAAVVERRSTALDVSRNLPMDAIQGKRADESVSTTSEIHALTNVVRVKPAESTTQNTCSECAKISDQPEKVNQRPTERIDQHGETDQTTPANQQETSGHLVSAVYVYTSPNTIQQIDESKHDGDSAKPADVVQTIPAVGVLQNIQPENGKDSDQPENIIQKVPKQTYKLGGTTDQPTQLMTTYKIVHPTSVEPYDYVIKTNQQEMKVEFELPNNNIVDSRSPVRNYPSVQAIRVKRVDQSSNQGNLDQTEQTENSNGKYPPPPGDAHTPARSENTSILTEIPLAVSALVPVAVELAQISRLITTPSIDLEAVNAAFGQVNKYSW